VIDTKIYRLIVHNLEFIFHNIFRKRSQAKKVAKPWSEPDSFDSSFENESPVQPVIKK